MPQQGQRSKISHRRPNQNSTNHVHRLLRGREKCCSKLYQQIAQLRYEIDLM